jgi:four helix bundle protein
MAGDFAELRAWREAAELAATVCALTRRMQGPGAAVLANQLVRAAVSVAANVAEGYGRGLRKDGLRLLIVARASAAELESHLRIAVAAGMLPARNADPLIQRSRFVRYLIRRFAESVERRMAA